MTNHVAFIILVLTNWVPTGDTMTKAGKQMIEQRAIVTTNMYIQEITLCTNRTLYRVEQGGTNMVPLRWVPAEVPSAIGRLRE